MFQCDDTPGQERILGRTNAGTQFECRADGSVNITNIGPKKEYNKTGSTITIDEYGDVHITGGSRTQAGGGAHIVVAGDAGITVGGHTALVGMQNVNIRCKSMQCSSDTNISFNAKGNFNLIAGGDTTMVTKGTTTIQSAQVKLNPGVGSGAAGGRGGSQVA